MIIIYITIAKVRMPESVKLTDKNAYITLCKKAAFVRKELQELFDSCSCDTIKLITEKYFYKKHNFFYKNEVLQELLNEGREEFEI